MAKVKLMELVILKEKRSEWGISSLKETLKAMGLGRERGVKATNLARLSVYAKVMPRVRVKRALCLK
jgi:hypothetical protein